MPKVAHCHKMLAEVAKGIMHEIYDSAMTANNIGYQEWKSSHPGLNAKQLENEYVRTRWGLAVPAARATLAQMLATPLDTATKDQIMEALTLDNTLVRGRAGGGKQVLGRLN